MLGRHLCQFCLQIRGFDYSYLVGAARFIHVTGTHFLVPAEKMEPAMHSIFTPMMLRVPERRKNSLRDEHEWRLRLASGALKLELLH